jgi:hypothetical protein
VGICTPKLAILIILISLLLIPTVQEAEDLFGAPLRSIHCSEPSGNIKNNESSDRLALGSIAADHETIGYILIIIAALIALISLNLQRLNEERHVAQPENIEKLREDIYRFILIILSFSAFAAAYLLLGWLSICVFIAVYTFFYICYKLLINNLIKINLK